MMKEKLLDKNPKDEYPGDEEVIKQVASYMKRMDDPRQAYQQMQVDFPHMGRGQRSGILAKAQRMAFGEDLDPRSQLKVKRWLLRCLPKH